MSTRHYERAMKGKSFSQVEEYGEPGYRECSET